MLNKKRSLYQHLLGFVVKKGNKISSKRILDSAFLDVSRKLGIPVHIILLRIFLKLNTFVEAKKVRIRRSTHIVPFSITFKRRFYLAVKWLLDSVKEDKRKLPFYKKLSTEIFNLLQKKTSSSLKKKEKNISLSLLNRSNIHYRW
jgi:small subunit ribosomal protein S7